MPEYNTNISLCLTCTYSFNVIHSLSLSLSVILCLSVCLSAVNTYIDILKKIFTNIKFISDIGVITSSFFLGGGGAGQSLKKFFGTCIYVQGNHC